MDNSQSLHIKRIRLKELEDFARSSLADPAFSKVAPISLVRARAQAMNPLADPEDLALVLAFHGDRCIGYHGVLPGYLNSETGRSKIYWLVTFYLDPDYRGRGCGKKLVEAIMETGVDLVATGLTRGAESVYRSLGFTELGELSFGQLRLDRLCLSATDKAGTGRLLRTLDTWWYPLAKKSFYTFLCRKPKVPQLAHSGVSRRTSPVGPGTWSGQTVRELSFERNSATVGWMLQNPWIVSRSDTREDVGNYYFSRVRDRFEFIFLEMPDDSGEPGPDFIILSLSSNKGKTVVKILDYRVTSDNGLVLAGYLALAHARRVSADRVEYPAPLHDFFRNLLGSVSLLKNKKRIYLHHPGHDGSQLATAPDSVRLDYCDSDTPFT